MTNNNGSTRLAAVVQPEIFIRVNSTVIRINAVANHVLGWVIFWSFQGFPCVNSGKPVGKNAPFMSQSGAFDMRLLHALGQCGSVFFFLLRVSATAALQIPWPSLSSWLRCSYAKHMHVPKKAKLCHRISSVSVRGVNCFSADASTAWVSAIFMPPLVFGFNFFVY